MNRKTLNWIIFGGGALIVVIVALLILPKIIADEMYDINPELVQKIEYCKKRFDLTIDDALVLAVARQESGARLDMGIRSSAGAVGTMQVMPSTGVGLRRQFNTGDLDPVTENICHGVLYLAGGMANYANYDKETQIKMTLAAYNGGGGIAHQVITGGLNSQTAHYVDIIWNVYYPAYQSRMVGEEFVQKQNVSYLEQILGGVVGGYITDKNLVDKGKIVPQQETPLQKTLKFFSKPFYVST